MENSLHYKLRICHTIAYDVRQQCWSVRYLESLPDGLEKNGIRF